MRPLLLSLPDWLVKNVFVSLPAPSPSSLPAPFLLALPHPSPSFRIPLNFCSPLNSPSVLALSLSPSPP